MYKELITGYVNLLKTAIGSGILSFPGLFKVYGIIPAIIFSFISAFFSILGLVLFSICGKVVGRSSNISSLVQRSSSQSRFVIDLVVSFKCFGVATSYLIIVRQILPRIIIRIFGTSTVSSPKASLFIFLVITGPISYFEKLKKLKYTSFFGILAVLIVVIASISNFFINRDNEVKNVFLIRTFTRSWLSGIGKFIFAFTCHQNIFPVQNEIEDNSSKNMRKIILGVVFSALIIYILFGLFNYLVFGESIGDNILESYDSPFLANLIQGLYLVVMGFSYPLQVNPCRFYVMSLLNLQSTKTKKNFFLRFTITTIIITLTYFIASSEIELGTLYSLIGATASTMMCFLLPGYYYINMDFPKQKKLIFLSYLTIFVGSMIFIVTITNSLRLGISN